VPHQPSGRCSSIRVQSFFSSSKRHLGEASSVPVPDRPGFARSGTPPAHLRHTSGWCTNRSRWYLA